EAIELQNRERAVKEKLKQAQLNFTEFSDTTMPIVGAEDIAEVVSMWTGVPLTQISEAETTRLLKMEHALHERIVGQEDAINIISKAVRRARAGFKDPKRPIGSFIFLGPTGVGKTELAKTLAEFMFGKEDTLIQIDMSEFMERHAVARLVGAPPGYIGYEDGGQLTEAIRRRPYSVVLLDEIEKAHPEAFNLLLQILEEGHLADAKGRKVDFRNTIIIMTSNIGADLIQKDSGLGFAVKKDEAKSNEEAYSKMRDKLMGELKKLFRPEFLNRIDGVVVFRALTRDDILQIVDVQLRQLKPRLEEHSIELEITDAAKGQLAREGFDQQFGARPLKRKIQQLIEDPLSEGVLGGEFRDNSKVIVDVIDGQVKLVGDDALTLERTLEELATPA
ncbi:MAG: AAA family ATPase, partial [Anaerolineales bacterium]|nr:AAA family ATPase [Anaerolineales bacterium]